MKPSDSYKGFEPTFNNTWYWHSLTVCCGFYNRVFRCSVTYSGLFQTTGSGLMGMVQNLDLLRLTVLIILPGPFGHRTISLPRSNHYNPTLEIIKLLFSSNGFLFFATLQIVKSGKITRNDRSLAWEELQKAAKAGKVRPFYRAVDNHGLMYAG